MPNLKPLKPLLSSLSPILGPDPQPSGKRDETTDVRHWYKSQAWQDLREFVFVRDHCRCAECRRIIADKASLVCHHKRPHMGQAALFWELSNLVTVCKSCHDGIVQARELADKAQGKWFN